MYEKTAMFIYSEGAHPIYGALSQRSGDRTV